MPDDIKGLLRLCVQAMTDQEGEPRVTLVLPRGIRRLSGFPRGDFRGETDRGTVYSIEARRIVRWLFNRGLIRFVNQPDGAVQVVCDA